MSHHRKKKKTKKKDRETGRKLDANPRQLKRSRIIVVQQQQNDDRTDEEEEETRSFEDVISTDLLYKIMRYHCDPEDWRACWSVCKRWRAVAISAFNPFTTNRPLYRAMLHKPHLLPVLLNDDRLEQAQFGKDFIVNGCVLIEDVDLRAKWIAKTVITRDVFVYCLMRVIDEMAVSVVDALCTHAMERGTTTLTIEQRDAKIVLTRLANETWRHYDDEKYATAKRAIVHVCRLIERTGPELLRSTVYLEWLMQNKKTFILSCLLECESVRSNAPTVNTMCIHALSTQDHALVRLLCEKDGRTTRRTRKLLTAENCWSAFVLACASDWPDVVDILFHGNRVDPAMQTQLGLRVAASKGSAGAVARLLLHPRCDPGVDNNVAVIIALKNGHVGVATMLVAHERCMRGGDSHSPMHSVLSRAISLGIKDKTFYDALARKQELDPNEHSHSPMRLALETKNYEALEMLLGLNELELSEDEKDVTLRAVRHRGDLVQRVLLWSSSSENCSSRRWGKCV